MVLVVLLTAAVAVPSFNRRDLPGPVYRTLVPGRGKSCMWPCALISGYKYGRFRNRTEQQGPHIV